MMEVILQKKSRGFLLDYSLALENLRVVSHCDTFQVMQLQRKALAVGLFLPSTGKKKGLRLHPFFASIQKKKEQSILMKSGIVNLDLVNIFWPFYEQNYSALAPFSPDLPRISLKTFMMGFKVYHYTSDDKASSRKLTAELHRYNQLVGLPSGKPDYNSIFGLNILEKHQISALFSVIFSAIGIFITVFWLLYYYTQLDVALVTLLSLLGGLSISVAEIILYYGLLFQ